MERDKVIAVYFGNYPQAQYFSGISVDNDGNYHGTISVVSKNDALKLDEETAIWMKNNIYKDSYSVLRTEIQNAE